MLPIVLYFSGMASSSGLRKYPHCLYEVGKTPIQNRSMNHQMVEETAGEEVWSEMRESTIRVIVKLK